MPRTGNKDAQAALFSFYTCKDGRTIFIGMTGAEVCKRGFPIIGLPVPGTGDPDFPEGFTGWMIYTPVGQRMEKAMEKYVSEHTMEEVEAEMQAHRSMPESIRAGRLPERSSLESTWNYYGVG